MTEFREVNDREKIGKFLMKDPGINIYQIGDLDPFFFPRTKWFAACKGDEIKELALLYEGDVAKTLLAFPNEQVSEAAELVDACASALPDEFYAHFGCGIMQNLKSFVAEKDFGTHLKMLLKEPGALPGNEFENIVRLGAEHEFDLLRLYKEHYPGNYFDKRMLETGKYFGYFDGARLSAAAGIHVYSPVTKVAALGNIVVDGTQRGKGICRKLVSVLCNDLLKTVDVIGLNVFSENYPAIRCYEKCGFEVIGKYEEFLVKQVKPQS
jgi:ribosomal protein S18 acetylase RimI-like enzyme